MNIFCVGKPPKHKLGQWISTVIVSFCFFSSGIAMAWTSPAFMKVKKGEVALKLNHFEMGALAAVPFLSRLLSPVPSGYVMDWAGRRGCLVLGRLLQILHWVLLYTTFDLWLIGCARFLSGWYSGMGAFTTGVYVGETTHKRIRGRTQALLNINFLFGAVFISIVGPLVSYGELILIAGAIDFVTFIFMFVIPETPYFYLKRDRREEAETALKWLRGMEDVSRELNRIERYLKKQMVHGNTYGNIFKHKATRKAFVIVQTLLILQRSSGMVAIISYASFITPDTPWLSNEKGPIVLNITYLVMCVLSSMFIDKLGRKTLLVFSTSGTCIFMFGCAVWFFLDYTSYCDVMGTEWIPILLLIGQAAMYSCGLCYIPALLMSEMFPMNIKAKANALSTMTATIFSMTIVFIFPPLAETYGMYSNFLLYTIATLVAALYSTTIIETRGKTLETIQATLEGRVASDSSISQARPSEEVEVEEL